MEGETEGNVGKMLENKRKFDLNMRKLAVLFHVYKYRLLTHWLLTQIFQSTEAIKNPSLPILRHLNMLKYCRNLIELLI